MKIFKSDYVRYQTLIGESGWQFIWEMDGITDIITGATQHDAGQLAMETRNIELRESWCNQRGITYVHTIAPDKASIYPEYLPREVTYKKDGLLHQFSEALLARDVTFVDLRQMLHDLKQKMQVYFKTDAHWNYEAAHQVYLKLMEPIVARFPQTHVLSEDELLRRDRAKVMELSAITDDPATESFQQVLPASAKSKCVFQTNSSRGRIQVFENPRKDLPRAVVFRDSFSSFFMPQLCESFSRVVVLNSRIFWFDLVEQEKADVVLVEVAERYLDPVVTDLGRKSFYETFGIEIQEIVKNGEAA